ncbi:MAG: Arc family DNA-binding protein [Pseudomonadota bacterium]|nr:Arc family DNA-binding protein [Pseudomonadota bacterium]
MSYHGQQSAACSSKGLNHEQALQLPTSTNRKQIMGKLIDGDKDTTIQMRVSKKFKEELKKRAKLNHRSITGEIERVMEAYLHRENKK